MKQFYTIQNDCVGGSELDEQQFAGMAELADA